MAKCGVGSFRVVGIAVRTNDYIEKSIRAKIPVLWSRFHNARVYDKVPNKKPESLIYAVYSEYEGENPEEYTFVLGVQVEDFSAIPEGMIGKTVKSAQYEVLELGNRDSSSENPRVWVEKTETERCASSSTTDFEVHDLVKGVSKAYVDVS